MEFESPDVEKDFPGLYASESGGKKSNESDFSDDSHEKHKKDLLLRSKDKKESKKDRGYAALEGESSPDEAESDMKSPSKSKKSKSFKFPSKKEKREKSREKEGGREAEQQKENKEKKKEKETTRTSKLRSIKDKKLKSKLSEEVAEVSEEPPVFGVPLEEAVSRSRCHDGVPLPLVVRNCLDFIEECGLTVEGIYKSSGNKSRAQQLKRFYNQKDPVSFMDCDPVTVAGLLKLFLRELPEPVISATLAPEFEDAANKKGEGLELVLQKMPAENRELLGWMVIHCKHLVANEKLNKCGGLQGVCATFAPLLQTSTKVLSALICYSASLFPSLQLSRYVPPLSGPSPALPSTEAGCKEELRKLESLLAQVHGEMNAGLAGQRREEQLWDAQRIVTQLKRKLRTLQKPLEPRASDDELRMDLSLRVEEDSAPASTATSVAVTTVTQTTTAPIAAVTTTVTTATIHVPPPEPVVSEVVKEKEKATPEEKAPADIPEPVKEAHPVPEESNKTVAPPVNKESPVKETLEVSPTEDLPDTTIDLEREEMEQRALQETLEALAEELAERVVLERTEVHKLRLEVARSREDNQERSPDKCEHNDMNLAELLEENENLQEKRDTLCRLIIEERKALAWTRAQIALQLHLRGEHA